MTKADGELRNLMDGVKVSDLDLISHNPTDYEAFRDFNAAMEARYEATQESKRESVKAKNFSRWLESIPPRWRKAAFKRFRGDAAAKKKAVELYKNNQRAYYIAGPHTSGKTYLAYAILTNLVGQDKLKPSEIKVITESDLLSLASGGWETRSSYEALFDRKYRAYFFDSLGSKERYDDRRDQPAISKIIEEAYNRSAYFIATSHMDLDYYCEGIPESAAAKLKHMVKDGVVLTGKADDGADEHNSKWD